MKTEQEYVDELIEMYHMITSTTYNDSIQCAIIDITNTIDILNEILDTTIVCNTIKSKIEYYQTVLQILKDKLTSTK